MYKNSVPVVVLLQPVILWDRIGLLVIRRANSQEDGHNLWAFPGGYVEQEDVRDALAREVREELGLKLDPAELDVKDVRSVPDGTKHLIFMRSCTILERDIPPFIANSEVTKRKVITHSAQVKWAFPLHREQAKKFFAGIKK